MPLPLQILDSSLRGWLPYKERIGFVPDPMILRAGEIFLNGHSSAIALERSDANVWNALQQNVAGVVDFFDMVVTRDTIPLINYGDTFDHDTLASPLDQLLGEQACPVEIGYAAYQEVKRGALSNLASIDRTGLANAAGLLFEMDAFRYDWKPHLELSPGQAAASGDEKQAALAGLTGPDLTIAQFLLGGLIFSGFAQASDSVHYIQPKRSRFFLGLTAAPDKVVDLDHREEDAIFTAARERLVGSDALLQNVEPLPPVLPYLVSQKPAPTTPVELLESALRFRQTRVGKAYREQANLYRADGVEARRAASMMKRELETARALLAPFSNLDPHRSKPLEISLKVPIGILEAGISTAIGIPNWLRYWWNVEVPFGGLRKSLRRMWMAAESYDDFSAKLRAIWLKG